MEKYFITEEEKKEIIEQYPTLECKNSIGIMIEDYMSIKCKILSGTCARFDSQFGAGVTLYFP